VIKVGGRAKKKMEGRKDDVKVTMSRDHTLFWTIIKYFFMQDLPVKIFLSVLH